MIEILHDPIYQNHRNYGSVVDTRSCRIEIISFRCIWVRDVQFWGPGIDDLGGRVVGVDADKLARCDGRLLAWDVGFWVWGSRMCITPGRYMRFEFTAVPCSSLGS